ncbi:MAG: amidohydrolase, partial [Planctomycetota bacterium]
FGPYALSEPPVQERVRIVGATVWTCGPAGIVRDGELRIAEGRILYAGPRRDEPAPAGFREIDGAGKHLTPGIIDCHSHTGISNAVNESGQACTAEVRIGDVTNPDSVNWYRQLAGGVTCVQSLHGSANPIGGQSQVNKLRWGVRRPDEMHFEGAPPGIKFALGENVKQSNWGEQFKSRYPQTRMGVETFIRDRLTAAREYAAKWKEWEQGGRADPPPRRDLELDALAEFLAGERRVHCHSYRQDEILMMCRIAGDFGFRIGTFQHVLEGYKVAEAIREHAVGGSCFSDWWAYKVEVQDAIPDNGAIMHDVGVVVTFNSDSSELARRLNVEAAKAMKYGGLPPGEALRFVTLNAAVQLGIDDRVGSLERGKDADFALWSGDPLSTFSRCESTWVDGREYFSLERDLEHRRRIAAERTRILQKLLRTKKKEKKEGEKGGEETGGGGPEPPRDRRRAARRAAGLDKLRRGIDPEAGECGECGRLEAGGVR